MTAMTTTTVGAMTIATPSDREIVISRAFDAPRALVFDCHTKPELVCRWLLGPPGWSMPVCDIDLRVGGKYRYVWRNDDGREMGMGGVFHEIAPPECIVTTELFDEDWTGGEARNVTVFTEADRRTTMTMTIAYSSREARDGALATGMTGGMEQSYQRLEQVLTEGGPV
jgi:uncharacterized protein YndB with AHSA1/START domain